MYLTDNKVVEAHKKRGFTIVELLIVIVVIGILAAITIVAYNGVQTRALASKRQADVNAYVKAVYAARITTGNTLGAITGSFWSAGQCLASPGSNLGNVEPKDLPKTNSCWVQYYDNLSRIGKAAGINLDSLKSGDMRGNPYVLDENEGENGGCGSDVIYSFVGNGTASITIERIIPTSNC